MRSLETQEYLASSGPAAIVSCLSASCPANLTRDALLHTAHACRTSAAAATAFAAAGALKWLLELLPSQPNDLGMEEVHECAALALTELCAGSEERRNLLRHCNVSAIHKHVRACGS